MDLDLVVWDWDGTVADSTAVITQALIKAAAETNLPPLTPERARSIIGLGLRESLQVLFGDIPVAQAQALTLAYNRNYFAGESGVDLFPGIEALIQRLHQAGVKQAVATGKGRRGLNHALSQSGLASYFIETRTVDECFSKPHPQMLMQIMDELRVLPQRTVMVGDSIYDMHMGKQAGVATAAVTYGSHTRAQLQELAPDQIFDTVQSLTAWLLEQVCVSSA